MELKNKIIRFGIICQSPILKNWEANCINKALDIKNVELSLIIYPTSDSKIQEKRLLMNLLPSEGFSKMFFHWYENFFFRPKCNLSVDLKDKFKKIPSLYCMPQNNGGLTCLRKEDIQKIREANLDFIVLFSGFADLKGEILKASRHGIWTYKHGDLDKYLGDIPGFWEIYNDDDVTGAFLYKLSVNQNEYIILKDGYYKTKKHSFVQNFNNVHIESERFLKEICSELNNDVINQNKYLKITKNTKDATVNSKPNNLEFAKFQFQLLINKFKKNLKNLFLVEQWNIGYTECSVKDLIEKNDDLDIHWLLSPSKKRYFADAFVIKYKNNLYTLFENYEYKSNKANISSIPVNASTTNSNIKISLRKPHHLSYPFLFKNEGDIYMIPGEWQTNRVLLYKQKKFPTVWQKRAVLLEGIQAVDPTLVKHNDLWWLFCTSKFEGPDLRLFIYYSEDLLGPWMPHKKNPVKTDIRSARPAGNFFEYKRSLIRPSQDSSQTYGGRIVLNKICKLTPYEFAETPIKFIDPNQRSLFNKGLHTLSVNDKIILLDGKRNVLSSQAFKRAIKKKVIPTDYKTGDSKKHNFISIPEYIDKSVYQNAISEMVELLKSQNGVQAIYQMGNINHPGISDIDIFIVFEDNVKNSFNPRLHLNGIYKYLFTHNIGAICKSHFEKINKYSIFHNINQIWGKKISIMQKNLSPLEIKALKIQIAFEYLISNFIDLSIQLKYGVIKLRTFLQHIKAIRYDLEFLEITSGEFHDMVHQSLSWLDNWFEQPIDLEELNKWIIKFYYKLQEFLDEQAVENSFYIPNWANMKYGRNVKIESKESFGYRFKGFWLPKSIASINKKAFNLNNRLNKFIFNIPHSTTPDDKILDERITYYKEIVDHVSKCFPNFTPQVSGIALKII